MTPPRTARFAWLLAASAAWIGWGCDRSGPFAPQARSARAALDSCLSAWARGETPESLAGRTPPLHAIDYQWKSGVLLSGYTVIEELPGDGHQRFKVKLLTAPPKGRTAKPQGAALEEEADYFVVGLDPVWVYRDQDYARILSMDDNPKVPAARPKRGTRSR